MTVTPTSTTNFSDLVVFSCLPAVEFFVAAPFGGALSRVVTCSVSEFIPDHVPEKMSRVPLSGPCDLPKTVFATVSCLYRRNTEIEPVNLAIKCFIRVQAGSVEL